MEKQKKKINNMTYTKIIKIMTTIFLILVISLSWNKISKIMSSSDTYKVLIASLDNKKEVVTELTTVSTVTALAITALPDDTGTVLAEKISDISTYFIVVLIAIYLEKILLTISGYVVFKWFVPIICLLMMVKIWTKNNSWKNYCNKISFKIILLSVVLMAISPISIQLSNLIENTHTVSIDNTVEKIKNTADEITENDSKQAENGDEGLIGGIVSKATGLVDTITSGVSETIEEVENLINNMMDAFVIFVITTCIMPVAVMFIVFLVVKWMLGNLEFLQKERINKMEEIVH